MSNNAKIPWNTQKTPTKHVLRLFEKFLKIRFSAEKSGSRLRFRAMLKYLETLRKHQLNMFWGFLKNSWKSGSLLKNPVLCYRCRTMLKIPWSTQKTPPKHVLILNNLLAMVRCLEQPTLFIILQMICTDQNWMILLESIDYHEAARKASFLGSMCEDSLMAANHFERRFDALMKYVINSQEHPIGKVVVVVVTLFSNTIHEQNTSNTNLTNKAYPGYCKHVLCWRLI